jgi:hypothetical protein
MSNNIEGKVVVITGAAMSQPDDVDINESESKTSRRALSIVRFTPQSESRDGPSG